MNSENMLYTPRENDVEIRPSINDTLIEETITQNTYSYSLTSKTLKTKEKLTLIEFILHAMAISSGIVAIITLVLFFIIKEVPTLYTNDNIIKSLTDANQYEVIRLDNGIKVIMIQDKNTTDCSAALILQAGSLWDPQDSLGIAHLTQHMLLSQASSNSFGKLLSDNFGELSGEIDERETSFYFQVGKESFDQGLKYFALMLQELTIDNIDKIINDINVQTLDSFTKNDVIEHQIILNRTVLDKKIFTNGNRKTYKKIDDISKALTDFHSKNYIGKNMNLVVFSNLDIRTVKGMVIQRFADIKEDNKKPIAKSDSLIENIKLAKIMTHKTLIQIPAYIDISFIFKKIPIFASTNFLSYIQYLLQHTKEASLFHYLNNEFLIDDLTTFITLFLTDHIQLTIRMNITQIGEMNIDKIIIETFKFIKLIRDSNIDSDLYQELMMIHKKKFLFKEQSKNAWEYTLQTARNMIKFQKNFSYLQYDSYLPPLDQVCLKEYINQLIPENSLIYIVSRYNINPTSFPFVKDGTAFFSKIPFREEFYSKEFNENDILPEAIVNLREGTGYNETNSQYQLRKKGNKYITQLTSINSDSYESTEDPKKIIDEHHIKIYYKYDNTFKLPKAQASLILNSLLQRNLSEVSYNSSTVYYYYLQTSINIALSEAIEAGNDITLSRNENCIIINVQSFSDVIESLLREVISITLTPHFTDQLKKILEEKREQTIRSLKYWNLYEKSQFFFTYVVKEKIYNMFNRQLEKHQTIDHNIIGINDDIKKMIFRGIFYGNIDIDVVKSLSSEIRKVIDPLSFAIEDLWKVLNEQNVFSSLVSKKQFNGYYIYRTAVEQSYLYFDCVSNYFFFGKNTPENMIYSTLFLQIWGNTFVNIVRNQMELAYYVYQERIIYENEIYFNFAILSKFQYPAENNHILIRILPMLKQMIEDIDETNILYAIKENLIINSKRKEKSLSERMQKIINRYGNNIENYQDLILNRDILKPYNKGSLLQKFNEVFIDDIKTISFQLYKTLPGDDLPTDPESYPLNEKFKTEIFTSLDKLIPRK